MTIKGTFSIGGENIEVIVRGNELLFFDIASGTMTTIDGLKLNRAGSIKEFPDLEGDPEWRKKTIERFREKVKDFATEKEKLIYVRDELIKHGYQPLFFQQAGHRPSKWN